MKTRIRIYFKMYLAQPDKIYQTFYTNALTGEYIAHYDHVNNKCWGHSALKGF